ncbi:hypothetical protein SEA_MARIETTA_89 [Gordonia phage Marietta]|uniref:Uncharacterized protein n=1 Tax=Gordonia phage Marietta TaxID=2301558 RepID=A0A385DRH5_9CAUD|nr:hypothetical protein KNU07_gp89 [Gordonia phage Marietta]AXQ61408.1 hypothetical protein SEA_MARIETTA_89 [Gordonia phage Marietta]QAU06414.1 hypothetical protein SEA_WHOSEMANZ_89 [Gordonia phage WhoseManz]
MPYRAQNRNMIAAVQSTKGLSAGARLAAGPAVVDARIADRNGWIIVELSPYALTVRDVEGFELHAEYSTASNGVTRAWTRDGDRMSNFARSSHYTLRERVVGALKANGEQCPNTMVCDPDSPDAAVRGYVLRCVEPAGHDGAHVWP